MTAAVDLRFGKWEAALADVVEVDNVITDPPFSSRTHKGQRAARRDGKSSRRYVSAKGLPYASMSPAQAVAFVSAWAPRTRRWFCVFTSHDLVEVYAEALAKHGRYVFAPLACVQPGSNVRLVGDGPSNWTTHLVVARPRGMSPRSGTLPGAYIVAPDREFRGQPRIPGGKPLALMTAVVRDYSRPGELVCDPFAGGATTLRASDKLGRRAVGAEAYRPHFKIGTARLRADALLYAPALVEAAE